MSEKDEKGGSLVKQERQGIERRNTDLFRRGLEMLDRKKAQELQKAPDRGRREFTFTTVTLNEYGDVIEQQTGRAWEVVEDLGGGVELEMVEIPGGEFWMGSTAEDVDLANKDNARYSCVEATMELFAEEKPRHLVHVSPFFFGKYPVTQIQWAAVMGSLPEIPEYLRGKTRPIVRVSWEETVAFCEKLSQRMGHEYRLPSEAEWEYAARAGTTTPFAFGETITPEIVNYWGEYPYGLGPEGIERMETVDVGSLGVANAFGLYDMHGNVYEWCEDDYHDDYKGAPTDGSAWIDRPERGPARVYRGGDYFAHAGDCRSAYRDWDMPSPRIGNLGFRLLRASREDHEGRKMLMEQAMDAYVNELLQSASPRKR
ncbi:MAG: formylglycine-generating enzyme family protein [Blastocatellia bacterium]